MADSCSDIYAAIARLEAKIDGIPRVNEQSIVQNVLGSLGNSPVFIDLSGRVNSLGGRVNTLGNSLDNLRGTFNQFGERINSAVNSANQSKVAVDRLGRNVIDTQNRLGGLQNQLVNADQRLNGLLSQFQRLNDHVNGVLAKLSPLFNILGIVGALAGLAALAGIIHTVFPRLDAHDRELDAQRNMIFKSQSLAIQALFQARDADKKASGAIEEARLATQEANAATNKANAATSSADKAIAEANAASATADKAIATSNANSAKADKAILEANAASATADKAIATSNANSAKADKAILEANAASATADKAIATSNANSAKADKAILEANAASATADKAIATSNANSAKADKAILEANAASATADKAIATSNANSAKADKAILEANAATAKANQGLSSIDGVATVAGVALTTSSTALNTAQQALNKPIPSQNFSFDPKAVKPVAISAAREEFDRRLKEEFKFDPRAVKPISIEDAQKVFDEKVKSEFKFDPKAVVPVTIEQARAEVKQKFDEIKQYNDTQLASLGDRINKTAQDLGQKIANIIIPPATASEPTVAQLEKTLKESTTFNNLQNNVTTLQTQQANQIKMDTLANQKLDTVNQKLDSITQNNSQQNIILGSIETIVKGIQNLLNTFTNQINNIVSQFNIAINKINDLVNKLNTFITSVNNYLRNILNYVIAILAILTFLRPVILLMSVNVGKTLAGLGRLSKWLRLDRAWNMLIYAGVLHNAFMLSNSFGQTLLAATNAFLKAFVLSDADGESFDIGQVLGKQIKEVAESIFGARTVAYWEMQWKKFNRVYQATANILNRLMNIHSAIFTVLEIIGSRISKVGNALRNYGAVGEKAYETFNESDNFQHPIFIRMQRLQEAASSIEIVSSSVTTVKTEYKGLQDDTKELKTAITKATTQNQKADEAEIKKILDAKIDEAAVQ